MAQKILFKGIGMAKSLEIIPKYPLKTFGEFKQLNIDGVTLSGNINITIMMGGSIYEDISDDLELVSDGTIRIFTDVKHKSNGLEKWFIEIELKKLEQIENYFSTVIISKDEESKEDQSVKDNPFKVSEIED